MLSHLSTQRKGELLVISSALIWALFPAITVFLVATIPPVLLAGLSMLSACFLFAIILTIRREWHTVWEGRAAKDIFIGTMINGVGFHGLVFFAMAYTTAGNAAIIMQMEVFFAFLTLSLLIRHEPFCAYHFLGAVFMVAGAFIILHPQTAGGWQAGNWLLILAAALAPIGNFFQRRARLQTPAEHIMLVRSIIAGIFLIILSRLLGETVATAQILRVLPLIFLNGFLVMGLAKILWMESFIRIPITKANSLSTIVPFFALIFAFLILGEVPSVLQLLSVIPISVGVLLLMRNDTKSAGKNKKIV